VPEVPLLTLKQKPLLAGWLVAAPNKHDTTSNKPKPGRINRASCELISRQQTKTTYRRQQGRAGTTKAEAAAAGRLADYSNKEHTYQTKPDRTTYRTNMHTCWDQLPPTELSVQQTASNSPPKAGVLAAAPNAGVLLPHKLKPPLLAGWLVAAPNSTKTIVS
jgi:hypothetical protein